MSSAAASIVVAISRELRLRELEVGQRLPNIRRVVARSSASSSARRAKPSAAAATEVRKTSSVRIATLKPCAGRADALRRGTRQS